MKQRGEIQIADKSYPIFMPLASVDVLAKMEKAIAEENASLVLRLIVEYVHLVCPSLDLSSEGVREMDVDELMDKLRSGLLPNPLPQVKD